MRPFITQYMNYITQRRFVSFCTVHYMSTMDPLLVTELVKALDDPDSSVRYNAAYTLVYLEAKGKKAVPALINRLQDLEKSVRDTAAWALGSIGPEAKNAAPALIKHYKEGDIDQKRIMWALWKISGESLSTIEEYEKIYQPQTK